MSKNIILGNMSAFADFGGMDERYKKFLETGRPAFRSAIENTLLFDQIVIPTNDFMPLALLVGVLGEKSVLDLFDRNALRFVKFKGLVGYAGGGVGVGVFNVSASDGKPKLWSAPIDEAADFILNGLQGSFDRKSIKNKALRQSIEIPLAEDYANLASAVYSSAKELPDLFSTDEAQNLTSLPGIPNNQLRVLGTFAGNDAEDGIVQLLRLAQANIETRSATVTSCEDIFTSTQVGEIYKKALCKLVPPASPQSSFFALREIASIPDIGETVLNDLRLMPSLLELRDSRDGIEFRKWFHENIRTDEAKVAAEYAKLLKSASWISSSQGKKIRFLAQGAITVGTGFLDPLIGIGIGLAGSFLDSFLLENVARGASPKIFLENLDEALKRT